MLQARRTRVEDQSRKDMWFTHLTEMGTGAFSITSQRASVASYCECYS
jgi:hypothetical protein